MAENATSTTVSLLDNAASGGFECSRPIESFTVIVDVISLLINSFHLCIISRLEALKGTQYRYVLINIVLADIVNTTSMATVYSCYDFFGINFAYGEPKLRIPIMVMLFFSNYISFHVFVVASMEKYLAICKPFSYQSSVLVRSLPIYFITVWLYVFSFCTAVSIIEGLDVIAGATDLEFVVFRTIVFAIAPNLLSGTLLIKVYRELRRMRSRSENSVEDDKTRAAMYLIIIFTLEMIVFLLNSICVIALHYTGEAVICKIWNGFIKAPYTIFNTVIYGWRTQSYRQYVRRVLGCNGHRIGNAEGELPQPQ